MAASCRVGWSDQTRWQRDRDQADRQRDRQAGRETDGQTDRHTGIHACRQRNRHVGTQTSGQTCRKTNRQTGREAGRPDRPTDKQAEKDRQADRAAEVWAEAGPFRQQCAGTQRGVAALKRTHLYSVRVCFLEARSQAIKEQMMLLIRLKSIK